MPEQPQRPRFSPTAGGQSLLQLPEGPGAGDPEWIPLIHCPADFPPELFEMAISQLIHHPEYNSTLILRSETVSETDEAGGLPDGAPQLVGFRMSRNVHRKLLPRRPGRDAGLEQHCTLYRRGNSARLETQVSSSEDDHVNQHDAVEAEETGSSAEPISVLVLTPILEPGTSLPYYHPAVSHLAFRCIPNSSPSDQDPSIPSTSYGTLQIDAIPLPGTPTDLSSRLYRTSLALLETLHRYGWGALTNYKKRVKHDCIVPREAYQDLYLVMRERHKYLVDEWKESTDPLKHVFEDIGIATFLILLWKQMYSASDDRPANGAEPWRTWGRPSSGFLDLGCGNGLLTHILVSEGYNGHGIDVRKRVSWDHYSEATRASLHVVALDPTSTLTPGSFSPSSPYLTSGIFIIGNHADELTPWVPILSTLHDASGYLSIPCCPWTFDMKYERSKHPPYPVPVPSEEFVESLGLGGEGSNASAYSMYRIWLSSLHARCGWVVESETLRIPSTRNWALVGRRRADGEMEQIGRRNASEIVEEVVTRGVFKTRRPEGKAGEH
ncbi:tRNA(Ser) Um(44) 2'-O-methyltransferase [Steccherinum ochraceum]|uniref:tRNA (uracil-O(2)-)-methyltransferase n=1 Tax=Steccherinum ochraceum TaxID=92696 RepID=A0A4V2MVG6_9APHY|nr:tRNA(Ser) Um(44) 2'-O-methyltransferase [Steccherinum ochraceum]